jgi:hypothetical protein
MQERLFRHPKIEVIWNHEVEEVLGDQGVTGVRIRDVKTGATQVVPATGFFVAIGHAPASELVQGQLDLHNGGYVKVEPGSTITSVPGVLRGRGPDRPRLPPGGDFGWHGLHGRARRRALARGPADEPCGRDADRD